MSGTYGIALMITDMDSRQRYPSSKEYIIGIVMPSHRSFFSSSPSVCELDLRILSLLSFFCKLKSFISFLLVRPAILIDTR